MNSKNICIIGAGIAGCTIARCLAEHGHAITILERQSFIGGNCHDYYDEHGVLIHKFGPHIFHTNYDDVWNFVNQFGEFNNYVNQVLVSIGSQETLVPFPINLVSIEQLFPAAYEVFLAEITDSGLLNKCVSISELLQSINSEQAHEILQYIYRNVYENYTAKMWGMNIKDVDPDVIKRVKINLNKEWNYFPDDKYCGLPIHGYTKLLTNMIKHPNIIVKLAHEPSFNLTSDNILVDGINYDTVIFTGSLDQLLNYCFGDLAYRSLEIEFEHKQTEHFQSAPIVNYPSHPHLTRICEYKYLTQQKIDTTTISYEYPGEYNRNGKKWNVPFYPINNPKNIDQYNLYLNQLQQYRNLILCGRLADYKYYDMDDIIFKSFEVVERIKQHIK